jgi:hypothetical protein
MKYSTLSLARMGILPILLLLAGTAAAQTTSDGSVYSRFGLGELQQFHSSQAQGMGGGATALTGVNYANFGNPAILGDQVLTRLSAGLRLENVRATDAADNVSRLSEGQFGSLQLSFPLMTNRWGLGFSFEPFSRVGYRILETGLVDQPAGVQDTVQYRINYQGGGGLQRLALASGVRINRNISVGASADFLFGILEENRRTTFLTGGYVPTNVVTATRISGFGGSGGVALRFPNLMRSGDLFSAGATVSFPVTLTGDRVRAVGESLDRDTLHIVPGSVSIPVRAGFGLAYRPDIRWAFVVDGRYEPWSGFESDFTLPGYSPNENLFTDRFRASAGFEVRPAGQDLFASFLARTSYRAGVYVDRSYVDPMPSANLQTVAVTAGVGLPALFSGTHIDINLEAGSRGTTDHGLVRDLFFRVGASANIGERWFDRRRLR